MRWGGDAEPGPQSHAIQSAIKGLHIKIASPRHWDDALGRRKVFVEGRISG